MAGCAHRRPLWAVSGNAAASDFGKEIEKGVDALAQLGLDLLARAFEQMHGYAGVVPILEFDGRFANASHFLGGKQAETIYQSQVGHRVLKCLRLRSYKCAGAVTNQRPCSSRYFSTSRAAMHPVPAAVIAWR